MVAMGGLMLAVSSVTLIEIGPLATRTPLFLAAGAFLAVAIGSLVAERAIPQRPA